MLRGMSQHRLPLLRSAPAPIAADLAGTDPHFCPGAVVVGDSGAGEIALRWAARLETELARRDRPACLVLVGGAQVGEGVRGQFSALATLEPALLRADADPAALRGALPTPPAGGLLLLAGPLALVRFRGRLNVLIGADEPLLRWPPPLRALRGRFELELSGDGFTLAPALADALCGAGA
jgi:hypothetical protein